MVKIAASLFLIGIALGCGNVEGGKGKDAGIDSKSAIDATPVDGATDAPMIDAPPGTVTLTVKNYLNWCSVKVNGGTESTAATQTVNAPPGGLIPLVAKAASASFAVSGNMWHHTMGDTGAGETGVVTGSDAATQSAATAVVGPAATCVWVCCPFTNGTGCNVAEQCP